MFNSGSSLKRYNPNLHFCAKLGDKWISRHSKDSLLCWCIETQILLAGISQNHMTIG